MSERTARDTILYIALDVHRWNNCEISACPPGSFDGLNDGSIGFMPVFNDVNVLKAAHPDAEIMKVTRMRD